MNDKSHAATPANATPHESMPKPDDGITGDVDRNSLHSDSHLETVGERLKRFYPEHYVTIITRMNAERGPKATAMVLSASANDHVYFGATLSSVFLWDATPEGHEFWKALAKREGS